MRSTSFVVILIKLIDFLKQANGFVDPGRRVTENAVVPVVWETGCTLLVALSERCVMSSFSYKRF
jgi:hypothetical protein